MGEFDRLYATLAENVPVGVYMASRDGSMQYANARFREILRLENTQDLTTEVARALIHPDDRYILEQAWYRACAEAKAADFGAYRYLHADGSVNWVLGMITPVFDANGQITHLVGVVQDVTREREHMRRIERLSRFNAARSQLNAAIANSASEQSLYERICSVVTDGGGFDTAALYLVDDRRETAHMVSFAGYDNVAQQQAREIDVRLEADWTLLREAMVTGKVAVSVDMANDERLGRFWQTAVSVNGLSGGCLLPLSVSGKVIGALALYANSDDLRDEGVLELIAEISRDVSRALENLAHETQRRIAERALARNEERLRMGLSVTGTGMFEVDFHEQVIRFDAACAQLLNVGNEPIELPPDVVHGMAVDEDRQVLNGIHEEVRRGTRDSYVTESRMRLPDGKLRWLRHHGALTGERSGDDGPGRMLGVILDVTESREMKERDQLAATVFDNSGESILVTDADRKIVMVNQAFCRSTGYQSEEALGLDVDKLRSHQHDQLVYRVIEAVLRKTGSWQGELWRKRKNGDVYPALATISLLRDSGGRLTNIVMQEFDISAQKEAEQRISHLAYRDALTDLPNRTLLRDRIEQSIASAHCEGGSLALLFLDLDHFKTINDSLGHAVGDNLLKEIAGRLSGLIREVDTVGRLGGDEFLIMLPAADADDAAHVAQKLLKECARPFKLDAHSFTVTPSIGIALYPKDGTDFDALLKSADTAMYRSKEDGRNAYRFYTPEMNQAVFQRMVLENSLRRAIENHEFVLFYQPKFELQSRRLVGVEALIRWHQPEMGMIAPTQFIPVAEESGLIEPIGAWVLEEACRQAKAWRDNGALDLRVSVNFSARQFAARNITELVAETLNQTGLLGNGLEVEITESLLAQDMEYTFNVLQSLRGLGVQVAIDDFGTGYSSLSYLKRFPIDRLKIDQSFVRDLVANADDRAIATAVVTMGHSLGMCVIAEGVETIEQMEILRGMGCDEVQGYLLGRPMPVAEFDALLVIA